MVIRGLLLRLAHAYAVIGNRTEAGKRILRKIEEESKLRKTAPYLAATIYAGLGEKTRPSTLSKKPTARNHWMLPY